MKKILLSVIVLCVSVLVSAQNKPEPPIVFETLLGSERAVMSLSLNKPIAGKFRYNNISSAAAFYDYQQGMAELVSVNSIIYQFHPNLGASVGTQYHFVKGFIPTVALHLSYANPTWLFVLTPYYNFMPWANLETVGIVEYKPVLGENLRLLTRMQGFYSYDFKQSQRERTMLYFRLGLMYKKFGFGLGGNIDGYRPGREDIYNYGGFLRIDI